MPYFVRGFSIRNRVVVSTGRIEHYHEAKVVADALSRGWCDKAHHVSIIDSRGQTVTAMLMQPRPKGLPGEGV